MDTDSIPTISIIIDQNEQEKYKMMLVKANELLILSEKAFSLLQTIDETENRLKQWQIRLNPIDKYTVEHIFHCLKDFATSQALLYDGLRHVIYSACFPLMESTYIIDLYKTYYSKQRPLQDIPSEAVTYIDKLSALVLKAESLHHHSPENVKSLLYKLNMAHRGQNDISRLSMELFGGQLNLNFPSCDCHNENVKCNYRYLIPDRIKTVNKYIIENVYGAVGDKAHIS